jgi:hypothetical protein
MEFANRSDISYQSVGTGDSWSKVSYIDQLTDVSVHN